MRELRSSRRFLSVITESPSSCDLALSLLLTSGPRLVSGQGLEGTGETMRIHRENQTKLQGMSQSEILEEQRKLLSQLGG